MKKVGLIFGGPSNEHEISIVSAKNIVANFPKEKYSLVLIYWDKKGNFYLVKNINKLTGNKKIYLEDFKKLFSIALPITHGKYGEDGVLQSLLESQKIKYCGCRSLSSALCMDKGLFKQYLSGQKIQQVKFAVLDYNLDTRVDINNKLAHVKKNFKLPLYIKAANSGSSVGITRIESLTQLDQAIKNSLRHDTKIVIEQGLVNPREFEVAVLGNKDLLVSRPGELKLVKDFYDYDDKYKLGQTQIIIPAKLPKKLSQEIMKIAGQVYKLCGCSGFARIDFLMLKNKIYLSEINSLPGFTDISMYPKLMMNNGLSYKKLISRIIDLAY